MADFAPPPGPPPPKVPEGWKAVYNAEYKEWFYVNLYTKASSWELPTAPAPRPSSPSAPAGPPPSFTAGPAPPTTLGDQKSLNPSGSTQDIDADARYAAQLQAEEDARASGRSPQPGSRNAQDDYMNTPMPPGYEQQQSQQQQQGGQFGAGTAGAAGAAAGLGGAAGAKGLIGKLLGKATHSGGNPQQGGYPPQQGYGGYPPQQGFGGSPPPQGYGAGGFPPQKPKKSGIGMGGAAALGAGGGLLGGALLAEGIHEYDQHERREGYDQGYNQGDNQGYNQGYNQGDQQGYDQGYDQGGYDQGGYDDGGYDDGGGGDFGGDF